jgi:hypothetical protein
MFADPKLHDAFEAFFHSVRLLFVGYGLADDDFELHLGRIRAIAGDQPPRHFALVPADTVTPFRRHNLHRAGVRLIPYGNPDGRHTAVAEILSDLARPTVYRPSHLASPPPRGRWSSWCGSCAASVCRQPLSALVRAPRAAQFPKEDSPPPSRRLGPSSPMRKTGRGS